MTIDIKKLQELYDSATPSPWSLEHDDTMIAGPSEEGDWDWVIGELEDEDSTRIEKNAAFIHAIHESTPELLKLADNAQFFEEKLADSIMLGAAEMNIKEEFVELAKELYDAIKILLPWAGEEVRDAAGWKDYNKATDAVKKAIDRYESD